MTVGGETTACLEFTSPFCTGNGVDFGCGDDPHPAAQVLVDSRRETWDKWHTSKSVHVRDIAGGFADWIDEGRKFDFLYQSHMLEDLRNPHAFLNDCAALLKPGGHLIMLAPDEDWYFPRGHPDANPGHKWDLNPERLDKWIQLAFGGIERGALREASGCRQGEWGFVSVYRR